MEEDPRVTARKQEAHNLHIANVQAIQAQQVRVAQAKQKAALAVELAKQEAVVKIARAHATALEQRFDTLKKALG